VARQRRAAFYSRNASLAYEYSSHRLVDYFMMQFLDFQSHMWRYVSTTTSVSFDTPYSGQQWLFLTERDGNWASDLTRHTVEKVIDVAFEGRPPSKFSSTVRWPSGLVAGGRSGVDVSSATQAERRELYPFAVDNSFSRTSIST
jgi:hypothetical protein